MRSWYVFALVVVFLAIFWPYSFAYVSVYVFVGCLVLGKLWGRLGRDGTDVKLSVSHPRVFFGEKAEVVISLCNRSFVPLTWADVSVQLPVAFQEGGSYQELISVPRRGEVRLCRTMECGTRGLFFLGPVKVSSSDIFGFGSWQKEYSEVLRFVVYPRVVSLAALGIPARQPLGSLRTGYRVFEDTTRFSAIRDYVPGDPIKRIDWKATVRVRKLQVKTYDPTITMSTAVFVNLNRSEYDFKFGADYLELAVIVAASILNHIAYLGQEVSLVTNGVDPLGEVGQPSPALGGGRVPAGRLSYAPAGGSAAGGLGVPSKTQAAEAGQAQPVLAASCVSVPFQKGQEQLVRILEVLARIRPSERQSFSGMLDESAGRRLPWGASLVFVVPTESDELLQELLRFKRAGHNVVLVILHPAGVREEIKARCQSQGIVLHFVEKEGDLDAFRGKRGTVA